jgi:hypothetical protein
MNFKYQKAFDKHKLTGCPPSGYEPLGTIAFCFVSQALDDPNNFLPALLIQPARVNSVNDLASKCAGFGLSLFQSPQGAKAKFEEMMEKTRGNFSNLVGDHLAGIALNKEDGIGSQPNMDNFSHFTFHE